ncbi:MAG: Nif3-like dinuclear metal center hexameric protein [Candidatus Cloacimonetes bacterium]|nr:Nif3-like dinuclear metal center hexameric protein [Candidatus Cloacimonadota bacterium]
MSEIRITVKDVIELLENRIPPELAREWDNVGLQVGRRSRNVDRILLALDVTSSTVAKALELHADLIISHHPLIFHPLKQVTDPVIMRLIQNDIAVYCAHTNLDMAPDGVNHVLAEILELREPEILSPETGVSLYHLAVYVPEGSVQDVSRVALNAGAGVIGKYSHCLNSYPVKGQFMPLPGSSPAQGDIGKLENTEEIKLEFFCDSFRLESVLNEIKDAHPYETPVYAVYPQIKVNERFGLGLVGMLREPVTLHDFAFQVKDRLSAPVIKLWKAGMRDNDLINKIAVCGGSGGSLLKTAEKKADVFVTGDLGYHTVIASRIPLIDAGHFYTEYPVLRKLESLLSDIGVEIVLLGISDHEIRAEQYL